MTGNESSRREADQLEPVADQAQLASLKKIRCAALIQENQFYQAQMSGAFKSGRASNGTAQAVRVSLPTKAELP